MTQMKPLCVKSPTMQPRPPFRNRIASLHAPCGIVRAKHNWIVGSPATCAEKIEAIYNQVGGFGTLLVFGFDYKDNPKAWHNSLQLLANEVMPRIKHLTPKLEKAA